MINIFLFLLVLGVIICFLWVNHKLDKEMTRNRILQAFIAGIIRAISDYKGVNDEMHKDDLPDRTTKLPIPYDMLLENIDWELSNDLLLGKYEKWLKDNRLLFFDNKRYACFGFNIIYMNLFDKKIKVLHSDELMSAKKKEWLAEDIIVTKENVGELEGEIGILRDLMKGRLDSSRYTPDNIDETFAIMFSHIRFDKLQEAKKTILDRKKM